MKKIAVTLLITLIIASLCACAAGTKGESAKLTLSSNPGTGCEWMLEFETEGVVEAPAISTETIESDLPGGTTQVNTYTFRGLKPGTTKLNLKYGHSWAENEYYELRTYELTVDNALNVTYKELPPAITCIALEGNMTTGYMWMADSVYDNVDVLNYVYIQDESDGDAVGVGGTFYFPLVGVAAGKSTMTFSYVSPDGQTTDGTASFTVTVADDLSVTVTQ